MRKRRKGRRLSVGVLAAAAVSWTAPAVQAGGAGGYDALVDAVDPAALRFTGPAMRNPFRPLIGPGSAVEKEQRTLEALRGLGDSPSPADPSSDRYGLREPEPETRGYRVSGIVSDGGTPLALVNGQVLGVGETMEEGGMITAITADAVVFTYEGRSVTLPIGEE